MFGAYVLQQKYRVDIINAMFRRAATASAVDDLLQRLRRVARQREYAHGLLPAQWEALRYLARANGMSRTPGALAAFLGTTRGTVSQTLAALESKGCVARVRSQRDRRVVRLELSEAGRALLGRDPQRSIRNALDDLPQEISGIMARGLKAVVERLDRTALHSFGICRFCQHFESAGQRDTMPHCQLTREPIAPAEADQICVSYAPAQLRSGQQKQDRHD